MQWKQFFEMMIIAERAARAQYETALKVATDPEVRAVLERLRDEEEFHADYLQENWSRLAPILDKKE
jgi:rubrerythrin